MKMLSALLGLVVMTAPAWAQTTPGDNPVINAYRQHDGAQTPTDNFMYNAYQRSPGATPGDNFMQQMMTPQPSLPISPNGPADPLQDNGGSLDGSVYR